MSFLNPIMLAGIAAISVPIIIHLLNRRRYKVVQWAAMDFLRQAMQRNRRILQIRDIILLVLRTAAVFLFGRRVHEDQRGIRQGDSEVAPEARVGGRGRDAIDRRARQACDPSLESLQP